MALIPVGDVFKALVWHMSHQLSEHELLFVCNDMIF